MAKSKYEQEAWNRFEAAAGRAIREWAELEYYLILHLSHLLKISHYRGRVIWATMPTAKGRFILLNRLADVFLKEPSYTEFKKLVARARSLSGKRNVLAHSIVQQDGKDFSFFEDVDADDGTFQFSKERTFQLTNIENWQSDIKALTNEFSNLVPYLRKDVTAAPKK